MDRHAVKCRVCNHPDRAAIEFDFLNWRDPFDIIRSYRFPSISTIYRHAHATGLFARRRLNLRFALERIVERVGEVPVTASAVIRAARAITRINDSGEWIDPPARLIISRADSLETSPPSPENVEVQSRPRLIFEPPLLDEPSHASSLGDSESQPEPKRNSPVDMVITLHPDFYDAIETRRRLRNENASDAAPDAECAQGDPGEQENDPPSQQNSDASDSAPEEISIANETHSGEETND